MLRSVALLALTLPLCSLAIGCAGFDDDRTVMIEPIRSPEADAWLRHHGNHATAEQRELNQLRREIAHAQ